MAIELKHAKDVGVDGRPVRERGAPIAGCDFRRDRTAAHTFGSLEDKRLPPGLRKKCGGDQPVVSTTDITVLPGHDPTRECARGIPAERP